MEHVDDRCHGAPLERSQRITLNFHPDREAGGLHILDAMARSGRYRSQFETGTGNGGLTAHPGGARWLWEQALFGGAYDDAPESERPKYGALNHRRRPLGGAPRFGSAHLRLREHVLDRATFCFPDSAFSPTHFATAHRFDLFSFAAEHDRVLELTGEDDDHDPLDGYVEAHVHGRVILVDDAEALVLDPCFRGTDVERRAAALGVPVEWHEGRVLPMTVLTEHVDYRGPEPVAIANEIARDGVVDAGIIGQAARSGRYGIQPLKQLWHLTAQWGLARPEARPSAPLAD
ncbi:uncharacterized protein DUF3626 [Humibacillus xanthopallidus]|uniref:Uncharacterized protein DUF3626 n=1 Tax=Humibacillus xanthopallidus TaxID=412689 RepID=A0A543PLA0_9MICO|nr:uncharacterized protein DUF3626 [Humibacillus xanthopallidus]